jgi:GTP-binding protein Era
MINALLNQKIAAVSPRPQTTRRNQLGILTTDAVQIVFIDTPGLHIPRHKLGEYMNEEAAGALIDADVILWLVDISQPLTEEDALIAERFKAMKDRPTVLLGMNKVDLVSTDELPARVEAAQALLADAPSLLLSAVNGMGLDHLQNELIARMPEGEPYYDLEQVTDLYERDIAADLIRVAALIHLREEVPHGIAIRIDEYTERGDSGAFIAATLFVERDSHKGIVIGEGGSMLKKIGSAARKAIEEMSGRKVFLELRVKVNKNWRDDANALQLFGYARKEDEG